MNSDYRIERIISGGQTGVDRAALDTAIFLDIPHGGWCPLRRQAEDGRIPAIYRLQETLSPDYAHRTERNVLEADGTLILYVNEVSGGTLLTQKLCRRFRRPVALVDLADPPPEASITRWLMEQSIRCLNIAGPRESNVPGIHRLAEDFLVRALEPFRQTGAHAEP